MKKPPIGFIGMGIMGTPMALHLAEAGYALMVHDKDRAAAERAVAQGHGITIGDSAEPILSNCIVRSNTASISGSGNIIFEKNGSADSFSISVSGSGKIKAPDLKVKDVEVKVSGSGNSTVYATENLDVRVSGSGDVYYKGKPNVNSTVSGSGSVRQID